MRISCDSGRRRRRSRGGRPIASRSRASTSAGPAVSSSDVVHAPVGGHGGQAALGERRAAAGADSRSCAAAGTGERACGRSRRPSTSTTSAGGASTQGRGLRRSDAHLVGEQAERGEHLGGGLRGRWSGAAAGPRGPPAGMPPRSRRGVALAAASLRDVPRWYRGGAVARPWSSWRTAPGNGPDTAQDRSCSPPTASA